MIKRILFLFISISFFSVSLHAQATLSVDGVGDIYALRAVYGPNIEEAFEAEIILAEDASAPTSDACSSILNEVAGKIVLIDRGSCGFVDKTLAAQAAGARAVVICNNDPTNPNQLPLAGGEDMGQVIIPTVGITLNTCNAIKTALESGAINATLTPSDNILCFEAQDIEPGTYTVDSIYADPVLSNLGGAPSNPEDGDVTAAVWYTYTPPADGILTVSSCEGGADTRLWIHTGSCDVFGLNLTTIVGNDDACIFDSDNLEDEYASLVSLPVEGGVTYIIEWDNRWESNGFDFSLEFEETEVVLLPGQVCDSAIVIQPGTYTIDTITEFGQTGVYNVNGSQWYSFTPEFTGLMSVSSCLGSTDTVNTRLLIHQGTCNALEQLILSDDECPIFEGDADDLAAAVGNIAVSEGETYLIEWSGRRDARGFDFTLTLDSLPSVEVSFTVDMSLETVGTDSVNMIWATGVPDDVTSVNVVEMNDDDGDGKWTASLPLMTLDTISYAFVNGDLGGSFDNVESVPSECGMPTTLGFNMRSLVVTATESQAVEVVCFNFCRSCGPENCESPFVVFNDDFENYQTGVLGPQSDRWTTWSGTEGGDEDGIVSTDLANSGTQSLKIEGDNGPQDVLLLLGDQTAGHFILRWKLFVPAGKQAYYNIQKFQDEAGAEFGLQAAFDTSGVVEIDAGEARVKSSSFSHDEWIDIEHYIDLNNDNIRLYIDGNFVHAWPFSSESFEENGTKQLGAVDFFPAQGDHLYYIDDIFFAEIPAAQDGQYAHTAVVVEAGMHTTPEIACFGAGFNRRSNGRGGAGYWYSYEANADGYIGVGSCEGGADSRVWVFGNGAQNLNVLGVNDDLCPIEAGSNDFFASYREVPVQAGETYLIMFDNVWEDTGFDWSLELIEGDLPAGNFCESAIAIEPSTITIDTLNGNAAVAGPNISFFSADLTNYANTEWYTFTPENDGTMGVFTCESLPPRSAVFVYDGSCGFDSLMLVATANNENNQGAIGCDPTEAIQNIAVKGGTTYYIEWGSKFDGARGGFDFELTFGTPAVDVSFTVDASILVSEGILSGQGIYIGGEFNNFVPTQMTDEGDNIYTFQTRLMKGDTVEYNFYNGPFDAENIDLSFGEDCVLDAFGTRFVVIGEDNQDVPMSCFGFCTTCDVVGIDDLAFAQSFNVFPNPAQDFVTLQYEFEQPTEIVIELSNALGQIVVRKQLGSVVTGSERLELNGLAAGLYQLSVKSGAQINTKLLVVE
ncbi:MAG: PA domain-containing protein [Bacteroidota bacterium]